MIPKYIFPDCHHIHTHAKRIALIVIERKKTYQFMLDRFKTSRIHTHARLLPEKDTNQESNSKVKAQPDLPLPSGSSEPLSRDSGAGLSSEKSRERWCPAPPRVVARQKCLLPKSGCAILRTHTPTSQPKKSLSLTLSHTQSNCCWVATPPRE